jgi:DNA-binding XRE family transcriptional regulator
MAEGRPFHGRQREPAGGEAIIVDSDPGSTVPRRQLGRYLRRLREEKGITVKAAADVLECSFQKVWRIEKGAVPVRGPDVKLLARACSRGISHPRRGSR